MGRLIILDQRGELLGQEVDTVDDLALIPLYELLHISRSMYLEGSQRDIDPLYPFLEV